MPAPTALPSQVEALAWLAAVRIAAFLAVYLTSGRARLGRPVMECEHVAQVIAD
jgi:hypothetical protein